MSRPLVAELDEALFACAEAGVALAALYPLMILTTPGGAPAEARAFVEDGMEALGRARRHINAARDQLVPGVHSVRVGGERSE